MNVDRANHVLKLWMKQNQLLSSVDQKRFKQHYLLEEILRFPMSSIENSIKKEGVTFLQDILADLQNGYIAYRHRAGYREPDYSPNFNLKYVS